MIEVTAALIRDKGKFMICQRPTHKARGMLWEFPGGKLEAGETLQGCLIRECKEELGVTLSLAGVFTDVVYAYPEMEVHQLVDPVILLKMQVSSSLQKNPREILRSDRLESHQQICLHLRLDVACPRAPLLNLSG